VGNRTVNMDVGVLRKVLKRYGHWRRLQDHVQMLSEIEGAPIGRALTHEEHKRLFEAAASNPEWEHVYRESTLTSKTSSLAKPTSVFTSRPNDSKNKPATNRMAKLKLT
jgi:hypothetical protein